MQVTLHAATPSDLPLVKNLARFYMYDMSEHMGWRCNADGQFDECESLEIYFQEPRKFAFVFRVGDEPAGFALILGDNAEPDVDYSITDFFILRKFRGQGVGGRLARELFDRLPGRWKVEQFVDNKPTMAFWRKVIDGFSHGDFIESTGMSNSGEVNVLRFNSPSASSTTTRAR
jgi:predicted acetyltransferase